jgi:hypothetical protein
MCWCRKWSKFVANQPESDLFLFLHKNRNNWKCGLEVSIKSQIKRTTRDNKWGWRVEGCLIQTRIASDLWTNSNFSSWNCLQQSACSVAYLSQQNSCFLINIARNTLYIAYLCKNMSCTCRCHFNIWLFEASYSLHRALPNDYPSHVDQWFEITSNCR